MRQMPIIIARDGMTARFPEGRFLGGVSVVNELTRKHERAEADFYGREDVDPAIAASWRGVKCWAGFVAKRIDAVATVAGDYPFSVY